MRPAPTAKILLSIRNIMDLPQERIKILVVGDSFDRLADLFALLERANCEAMFALGGRQGLRAMLSERPDVVLCEMGLYDMSGIDLCREVRADKEMSDTCVVLLAKSFHSGENVRAALNAGADDCVSEKGNLEQLIAKLTWLTQRRRIEREQELNYQLLRSRQIQIASIVKDAARMIRAFSGSDSTFGSVADAGRALGAETSHRCLAPELIASLASLLDEQVSVFERLDPNPRTAFTSPAVLTPNEMIHFDIAM